jgi:DNA repair exonuclease SbcCD ATPase subunit
VFTEVTLNTHTQTLIVGDNGSGKSTILDALSFVLFGKPFRKVKKGQLINSINNKNLLVECEFAVNNKQYLVRRGSKPNVFEVFQDGTLINLDAATGDYQEMLDKTILKFNQKSFSQIVVLGSASFVPFMQLTTPNRREVIEDLLDIQIFTVMNTLLKEKVSKNKTDILENRYAIDGVAGKIALEQQHIEELKSNNDLLIQQKQKQVDEYNRQIEQAEQSARELEAANASASDTISDQTRVWARMDKVVGLIRQLDARINKINDDASFFEENHNCPTCRQGISIDHKNEITAKADVQIEEINSAKDTLNEEVARLNTRIAEINTVASDITKKQKTISELSVQIRTWSGFVRSIEKEICGLRQNKQAEVNIDRVNELTANLTVLDEQKQNLINQQAIFDVASVLLKDAGIKTKIIRQYIPVINKLINKYLASMDFFVNFELNESFEETIKSRFRDEFSYDSFSEGEKSRIDLALLFTWRAIAKLRNSTSTNLLILDEVFDGSLDASGNEELLKILQTFTEGINVVVISHKTDAYLDKFERVLKFSKQKNFSQMSVL